MKPLQLVGYPHVERVFVGINDPLLASAVCIDNGAEALIMIAVDILFLNSYTICEIRKKIASVSTIQAKNILISCTHTHSGPAVVEPLVPGKKQVDSEYMEYLKDNIINAGIRAVAENGYLEKIYDAHPDAEIQVMQICESYYVEFAGEIFVEYSLDLKRRSPEQTFVINLANGELQGYVVTENADGYEADNGTLLPENGNNMVNAALKLIDNMRSTGIGCGSSVIAKC